MGPYIGEEARPHGSLATLPKVPPDTQVWLRLIGYRNSRRLKAGPASDSGGAGRTRSVVSVWKAMIKHQFGRLPLSEPPGTYLPEQRQRHLMYSVAVNEASVADLGKLPPLHRDLFDTLLICQALEYGLTLITADDVIRAYPVETP